MHVVGDVVFKGQGIGHGAVSGNVFVAKDAKEAMMVPIGSIIVTHVL